MRSERENKEAKKLHTLTKHRTECDYTIEALVLLKQLKLILNLDLEFKTS